MLECPLRTEIRVTHLDVINAQMKSRLVKGRLCECAYLVEHRVNEAKDTG